MAELSPKERLQPSLLDRLRDDEPEEKHEPSENRVLSQAGLRESVRRDLIWLFNSTNLSDVQNMDDCPEAARSVINYGLSELSGMNVSSIDVTEWERMLRQAIWNFEPRLIRNTVKVRLVLDEKKMSHSAMAFIVEAQLWSQPMPLQLYLRTEIDLESRNAEVLEIQG